MKLRTLTGTRFPATCACGCKSQIPANPEVKVTVDFDTSRPRLTYIPSHAPDASSWGRVLPKDEARPSSFGPDAGTWKGNGGNGSASAPSNGGNGGFAPASALPTALPKAPEPPRAPSPPPPLALLGVGLVQSGSRPSPTSGPLSSGQSPSPRALGSDASHNEEDASASPQAGRAWSSGGLTVNPGKFESVRAGYADYALPGETAEQLAVRVNAVIEADLRSKLALLARLHKEFGIPGPEYLRTSSASASTGAPSGALAAPPLSSPPPAVATPPAEALASQSRGNETPPCLRAQEGDVGGGVLSSTPSRDDPAVADLLARVQFELTDQGVKRSLAKRGAVAKLLELRGLRSLRECGPADEKALHALLDNFEQIDSWDLHDGHGQAPRLNEKLVLPA